MVIMSLHVRADQIESLSRPFQQAINQIVVVKPSFTEPSSRQKGLIFWISTNLQINHEHRPRRKPRGSSMKRG